MQMGRGLSAQSAQLHTRIVAHSQRSAAAEAVCVFSSLTPLRTVDEDEERQKHPRAHHERHCAHHQRLPYGGELHGRLQGVVKAFLGGFVKGAEPAGAQPGPRLDLAAAPACADRCSCGCARLGNQHLVALGGGGPA